MDSEVSGLIFNQDRDPFTLRRGISLMVAAGLLNAMIAGLLFCRVPDFHAPGVASLFFRAVIYVAVGAMAGFAATWLYWNSPSSPFKTHPPVPLPIFSLICASGWIWVPAMVIFYDQASRATALIAIIGAFLLGTGLRRATFSVLTSTQSSTASEPTHFELFAEALHRPPTEPFGYLIALGLFAGAYALIEQSIFVATALLGFISFLFAWNTTHVRSDRLQAEREPRRPALRLLCAALPAVLITIWALLEGIGYRNHAAQLAAALAAENSANDNVAENSTAAKSKVGTGGYESVILFPAPKKKQIIPPVTPKSSLLAASTKPLVVRFDGVYWYFQAPEKEPGPNAHKTRGSPLSIAIKAENFIPLTVEAHQNLGSAIRLSQCREIQVEIDDRDPEPSRVTLLVLLSDSTSPNKPGLSLRPQPVIANVGDHPNYLSSPSFKTIRFPIPDHPSIRKFDEITVELIPDEEHSQQAPKLAIEQFELLPR
jgi:hypothetical protein